MAKLFGLFRSVVFLGWLSVALASTTLAAGLWAVQMTYTAATVSAQAAKHLAKTKAKARLRRAVVAIPIAGAGAIAYFEEQDYQEWLASNPDGTRKQYACEVAALTAEVIDEFLQDLPEWLRPEPETVLGYMWECG